MKIIVVHGDHVEASRARLQAFIDSARGRNWQIERLSGGETNIKDALSAGTLFNETRLFLLENPKKLTKDELQWIREKTTDIDETFVVYATSPVTKTFISSLGKADKVETFELPKHIWKFLDSFYPGNAKVSLNLYHQTIETEAAEFVFALLVGLVKDLYHVLADPDTMSAPDWRKGKLKSQAEKFGQQKLEKLIEKMAKIDVDSKTGGANIRSALDLLFIMELQ